MSGRWPEPVRDPLPVGLLSEADVEEAFSMTTRFLTEPEDPAFDPMVFGLICAARAGLYECLDALVMARIDRELHGQGDNERAWRHLGEEYVARKTARRIIDELRKWLPEMPR